MRTVKHYRKALSPIWHLFKRKPWTWTGNKAFNRTKKKRFQDLAIILDDDRFRAFCSAIGFVEINWAFFESQMDKWVQISYIKLKFRCGGNEAPNSFSRKYSYLKEAFKLPALSKFKITGLELLERGNKFSVTRHDLTHGVITSTEPVNFFRFELVNRKLKSSGMHTSKDISFDLREFPKIAKELVDMGVKAVKLSSDLGDTFL